MSSKIKISVPIHWYIPTFAIGTLFKVFETKPLLHRVPKESSEGMKALVFSFKVWRSLSIRLFLNGFRRFYISSLLIDLLGSYENSSSLKSSVFFILTRRISPSAITESLSLNWPSTKIA